MRFRYSRGNDGAPRLRCRLEKSTPARNVDTLLMGSSPGRMAGDKIAVRCTRDPRREGHAAESTGFSERSGGISARLRLRIHRHLLEWNATIFPGSRPKCEVHRLPMPSRPAPGGTPIKHGGIHGGFPEGVSSGYSKNHNRGNCGQPVIRIDLVKAPLPALSYLSGRRSRVG